MRLLLVSVVWGVCHWRLVSFVRGVVWYLWVLLLWRVVIIRRNASCVTRHSGALAGVPWHARGNGDDEDGCAEEKEEDDCRPRSV